MVIPSPPTAYFSAEKLSDKKRAGEDWDGGEMPSQS